MRRTLAKQLIKTDHKKRYFLTSDVGYGCLEPLQEQMKDRFINVGIAEPSMISIAAGLALSGKEVYTYTMCCFYLRCIEQIKLDLCYQNLPVTMIGVGTDFDYEYHGTTHFGFEDGAIMNKLYNISVFTPRSKDELIQALNLRKEIPTYIRIGRFDKNNDFSLDIDMYPREGGSLSYFKKKYER